MILEAVDGSRRREATTEVAWESSPGPWTNQIGDATAVKRGGAQEKVGLQICGHEWEQEMEAAPIFSSGRSLESDLKIQKIVLFIPTFEKSSRPIRNICFVWFVPTTFKILADLVPTDNFV